MKTTLTEAADFMRRVMGGSKVVREGMTSFRVYAPSKWWLTCFYLPCGGLEITYLWVNPQIRSAGHAYSLMAWLCSFADMRIVPLRLWAMPFEERGKKIKYDGPPLNVYDLAAWYARNFGFQPIRIEDEWVNVCHMSVPKIRMLREPCRA